MLAERGLLDGALVTKGYAAVLRRAASKSQETRPNAPGDVRVPPF